MVPGNLELLQLSASWEHSVDHIIALDHEVTRKLHNGGIAYM